MAWTVCASYTLRFLLLFCKDYELIWIPQVSYSTFPSDSYSSSSYGCRTFRDQTGLAVRHMLEYFLSIIVSILERVHSEMMAAFSAAICFKNMFSPGRIWRCLSRISCTETSFYGIAHKSIPLVWHLFCHEWMIWRARGCKIFKKSIFQRSTWGSIRRGSLIVLLHWENISSLQLFISMRRQQIGLCSIYLF